VTKRYLKIKKYTKKRKRKRNKNKGKKEEIRMEWTHIVEDEHECFP